MAELLKITGSPGSLFVADQIFRRNEVHFNTSHHTLYTSLPCIAKENSIDVRHYAMELLQSDKLCRRCKIFKIQFV